MSAPQMADLHASAILRWPETMTNVEEKQQVADTAAARVEAGQVIGIGSGSTTYLVLWAIGQRAAREELDIAVTTSSIETATAARRLGLRLLALGSVEPDWGVDGADEVDPDGRLIKGRGGAMYREKILWSTTRQMYLAVDPSKYVDRLGQKFPVPIEVDPMAVDLLRRRLEDLDVADQALRTDSHTGELVRTESNNLILDVGLRTIPHGLSDQLSAIPGVVETGLFEGLAFTAL